MVFPCVESQPKFSSKGIGKELIKAAEEETLKQQRKGIATIAKFWDFWLLDYSILNFIKFSEIIIVDKIGEIIGNKYKF